MTTALATGLLEEAAPAKLNLTLRVLGKRADGYHELESLVTFTTIGDRLTLRPDAPYGLTVTGPTAEQAGSLGDNLVIKAARAASERIPGLKLGAFSLVKHLPAGGGLGGGSSDAAATLRLIARANGLALDDPRLMQAAAATGADVPVCLDPRPRMMRGLGERLSGPLKLPPLYAVLVGPGFPLATREVFATLGLAPGEMRGSPSGFDAPPADHDALFALLAATANDLEPPAIAIASAIADVIARLAALPGARLARMSGSGSTCFALFDDPRPAADAAVTLSLAHPRWWVQATPLAH